MICGHLCARAGAMSLLLVLLAVVQGSARNTFDIRIGFATPGLAGAPSEEQFLNQVIEDELSSLEESEACQMGTPDAADPDAIARRMDRLAERLSMAMEVEQDGSGAKLREELADAVGLEDILPEYKQRRQQASFVFDLRSRAPDQVLEASNPFIYHGKRVTDQGIMQVANDLTKRALSREERLFAGQMFDYADKKSKQTPAHRLEDVKKKLQEAATFGSKAVETAYELADTLYFGSQFLDNIPILGAGIQKLRELGRRTYEIMDTVRYMHRLWSKVKDELPDGESHTRQVLHSDGTKRMLTNAGIKAVKMIAVKLLVGGADSLKSMESELAAIRELGSRCAFYLFSQLVPRSAHCLIGRNVDPDELDELLNGEESLSLM